MNLGSIVEVDWTFGPRLAHLVCVSPLTVRFLGTSIRVLTETMRVPAPETVSRYNATNPHARVWANGRGYVDAVMHRYGADHGTGLESSIPVP